MSLDGITTHFLAKELNERLVGGRIDKIYQPDRYDIVLLVRQESQNFRVLMSANPSGPRIHISTSTRENPALAPSFCMLLRKHLAGARITNISSPSFERIIEISIATTDELGDRKEKRLIIEMMGRYSNIILVNDENRIFDSLLHVDSQMSRVREVMPARPYVYPPVQGKLAPAAALDMLNLDELPLIEEAANRPLEKALQESLLGFSPLLSREICYLASVDARKGIRQLLPDEKKAICRAAKDLLTKITQSQIEPATYSTQSGTPPNEFHALLLKDAGFSRLRASISEAMDAVYQQKDLTVDFEQKKRNLLSFCQASLQHALRKQSVHQSDISACKDMNLYQKSGQLLLSNHYQIPAGVSSYKAVDYEATDYAQAASAEESVGYDNSGAPDNSELQDNSGAPVMFAIELDPTRTVSQNAQAFFKRYSKCKNRMEAASEFLAEDNRAVDYLSTLYQAIESAAENEDLQALREEMLFSGLLEQDFKGQYKNSSRVNQNLNNHPGKSKNGSSSSRALRAAGKAASKRAKNGSAKPGKTAAVPPDNFRKYVGSEGLTILCGRNNIQNDLLTMKTASPDDLWFHVQKMPGTHVVLRCGKTEPSESSIIQAARTAAFFSRTWSRNEKNKASDPRQTRNESQDLSELKIAVDYCPVRNVKKPSKAKPGMVIYDHYKTVLVSPSDPAKLL